MVEYCFILYTPYILCTIEIISYWIRKVANNIYVLYKIDDDGALLLFAGLEFVVGTRVIIII